jgi:hypothetical protein
VSRPDRSLPPGMDPMEPTGQEAGWVSVLVWTQGLEEKSFASAGDRTPVLQCVVRHYTDSRLDITISEERTPEVSENEHVRNVHTRSLHCSRLLYRLGVNNKQEKNEEHSRQRNNSELQFA